MSNQTQVKKLKKRTEDYGQTTYVTPTYAPPIYPVYNPYKPPAHFTSQLESSDPALLPTQTPAQPPVQAPVQLASPTQTVVQPPVQFASPTQTAVQPPVQLASPVQPTVLFNTPFQTPIRFPSPVQGPVQSPVITSSDSFEHPNQALYAKPKRIAAHVLDDGYYRILEDEMEPTRYGLQRSLVLEPTSPNSFKTWIPKSCETPLVSLVGFTVLKSTMESDHPAPYYGKNYSLSFH